MKKTLKIIFGILVIVSITFFLVKGIAQSRQEEEVLSINKIQRIEGVPILTQTVVIGNVIQIRRYYGDVKATKQTSVSSKLAERIDQILIEVGDHIQEDQPLVRFDSTASQASVIQARLAMENARQNFDRTKALLEEGAVSRQLFDSVELQYKIVVENYKTADRAVVLLAPTSGRIARIDFKAGDQVNPGDILMTIVANDQLTVEFDVTQEDRRRLHKGQIVTVSSGGKEGVSGKITRVSLVTNQESRMFKVYADIPAVNGIYPGVLATVDVNIADRQGVIVVPIDAIIGSETEAKVVIVDRNIAHIRNVNIGLIGENQVEILSGLQQGEIVAINGHTELSNGIKVKVVKE